MSPSDLVERVYRRQAARLLAALVARFGTRHLALAEDALQEATLRALRHWSMTGSPSHPEAWILAVARNRMVDQLRREARLESLDAAIEAASPPAETDGDGTLGLMFACCHPDLTERTRLVLTLKLVCGFQASQVALALLDPVNAVEQRLVRGRRALADKGVEVGIPAGDGLRRRLPSVLKTLYLLFNEGYASSKSDQPIRAELCEDALSLLEATLERRECDTPEARALYSLMLLQSARFGSRVNAEGAWVTLDAQDRRRWDGARIERGMIALKGSMEGRTVTTYHLEAAIAAEHCLAGSLADTNWVAIVAYYDELVAMTGSDVARLNRAVARWHLGQRDEALSELEGLTGDSFLASYAPAHAALAYALEKVDPPRAAAAYGRALGLSQRLADRVWIEGRIAVLSETQEIKTDG